jgi:hypothetical protein
MAKLIRSYRISEELDTLLKAESGRMSNETGRKVSEADVIEIAVVAWLSGSQCNTERRERNTLKSECNTTDRHAIAETAMREAEGKYHDPISSTPVVPRRAESVAQRRAREAKEHAENLAEADTLAKLTGREDIEYDLENVPHQSALHVAAQRTAPIRHHYEVQEREAKPLARPHGGTEAKRRRDQS